jgi:hypothetical protein
MDTFIVNYFFGYLTLDAFYWHKGIKNSPFSAISGLWKGGLDHLSIEKKNEIMNNYKSTLFGIGKVPWAFLGITLLLLFYTVQEFVAK